MSTDIMIDIETLGLRPGCVVLSIGACEFDRMTGEIGETFYRVLKREPQKSRGLIVDPETKRWWAQQSCEARKELFDVSGPARSNVGPALCALRAFCRDKPVWGNGATFDISILEHLAHAFELGDLFDFRNHRDVRTVVDLGRMRGVDWKTPGNHHALDDAINQARYVAATIRSLTM